MRVIKGDIRSLDHSSHDCPTLAICAPAIPPPKRSGSFLQDSGLMVYNPKP